MQSPKGTRARLFGSFQSNSKSSQLSAPHNHKRALEFRFHYEARNALLYITDSNRTNTDTFWTAGSRTSTDIYHTSVTTRSSEYTSYHSESDQTTNKIIPPFSLELHTSQNRYTPQKRKLTSVEKTDWYRFLQARNLIPLPFQEQNWSGRGQHAEFDKGEEKDVPLVIEKALGHFTTALVQSVLSKRTRLACKTIKCGRRIMQEDAIKKVEHLQRPQHSHIVRAIGTYTIGKDLSHTAPSRR